MTADDIATSGSGTPPPPDGDSPPTVPAERPGGEPGGTRRRGRTKSEDVKRSHDGAVIRFRVFPAEAARLRERAAEAGMTVSEFCRRAASGKQIKSRFDYDAIIRLCKVQGDQARLGNLLKLAVGQAGMEFDTKSVNDLTDRLIETQETIKQILGEFSRR